MKFGSNVLQVNIHYLTESGIRFDVAVSKWRPWRDLTQKSAATWCVNTNHLPVPMEQLSARSRSILHSYFLLLSRRFMVVAISVYYRFGCCRRCSICVPSVMLMCVSDSLSVSCRYFRAMPSNSVKAGRLYLASLVMLQMAKGGSTECSVVQCFTKNCFPWPSVLWQCWLGMLLEGHLTCRNPRPKISKKAIGNPA